MKPLEQLRETETWVFDLDNTLYPASCGLMAEVSARMTKFVAERLNLEPQSALVEQKRMFREYGTTLRGLMNDHDVDPTHFMDFVHDVDYDSFRVARSFSQMHRPHTPKPFSAISGSTTCSTVSSMSLRQITSPSPIQRLMR